MSTRTYLVRVLAGVAGGCAAANKTEQMVVKPDAQRTSSVAPGDAESDAAADENKKSDAKKKAEKEAKRAKLTRDLKIARQKVAQAQLAMDHQRADDDEAVRKAAADRGLAAAKLEDLEKHSAPVRLEKARLSFKGAEDSVLESREELEQLEMMYNEQELGDKTSEIVIARAKRRLERAQWNLNIQTQELQNLEKETIPLERQELQLKVEAGEGEQRTKVRSVEANLLDKRIALISAEAEVARIETELKVLDVE